MKETETLILRERETETYEEIETQTQRDIEENALAAKTKSTKKDIFHIRYQRFCIERFLQVLPLQLNLRKTIRFDRKMLVGRFFSLPITNVFEYLEAALCVARCL